MNAELLIMECTGVDDEALPVKVCRERGHIHLQEIAKHAAAFKNKVKPTVVWTHYSSTKVTRALSTEHATGNTADSLLSPLQG